jgi:hypothetical protein
MSPTPLSALPACPFQRLLIFHLNFPEKCLNGKSLDEGASLFELSEQILYYHRSRRENNTPPAPQSGSENNVSSHYEAMDSTEDAVQFVGLVTALYSLPASLGDSDLENDRTKEVYFGDSSLIFVTLEGSSDIVAVAQVPRLYLRGSRSALGGGNPFAVRCSIERIHSLFCLLRGGGILHRLSTKPDCPLTNGNKVPSDPTPYPGMGQLFKLRKQLRRLRNQVERHSNSKSDIESAPRNDEINTLEQEISVLMKTLPIHSLRRDLRVHFNEYLGELSVIASRIGGASRCLVETMPTPIAVPSGLHVSQCSPPVVSSYCAMTLGLGIRDLLEEVAEMSNDAGPHLLGVSTFLKGQLMYTHTSETDITSGRINTVEATAAPSLSNKTVSLLMGYMADYRTKINQLSAPMHTNSLPSMESQQRLGFKRLTLSFGSVSSDKPQQRSKEGNDAHADEQSAAHSGYLSPPPLFMLSALDRPYCFIGPKNSPRVWAPLVRLPFLVATNTNTETIYSDLHMVMYEIGDFAFLLYMDAHRDAVTWETSNSSFTQIEEGNALPPKLENVNNVSLPPQPLSSHISLLLEELSQSLSNIVLEATEDDDTMAPPKLVSGPKSPSDIRLVSWDAPGQDIVFVDRFEHKLILFSDRNYQSMSKTREKKKSPGRSPGRRRFLGFSSGKTSGSGDKSKSPIRDTRTSNSDWSALGLDCRHRLSSHLPLDTVLAFDDVINEVNKMQNRKHDSEDEGLKKSFSPKSRTSNDGIVELCTCMSQGWIYAFADNERELYAFFDSSIYVTVADVQNAAVQIRKHLGEWAP